MYVHMSACMYVLDLANGSLGLGMGQYLIRFGSLSGQL